MTDEDAEREGLAYTGFSGRDKESLKRIAKNIRNLGYRAVVTISIGQRMDIYSVYTDSGFQDAEMLWSTWAQAQADIKNVPAKIRVLEEELGRLRADLIAAEHTISLGEPKNVEQLATVTDGTRICY